MDYAVLDRAARRVRQAADGLAGLISRHDAEHFTVAAWQEMAAAIGGHIAELDRSVKQVYKGFGLTSPQGRILEFMKAHLGEVVGKDELRGVAAIHEWARRIRELRVEHGWPIASSTNRVDLSPGEYILEGPAPDEALAERWQLAKDIRNAKVNGKAVSGKTRGLMLLQAVSPDVADKDQPAYVMKIPSYARRIRELDEEGWQIESNIDNPSLPAGSYRLISMERRPERVRRAIKLRYRVMERDGWKCTACGRNPNKHHVVLQVHHIKPVSRRGGEDPENLITLCAEDHAGRHAVMNDAAKDDLLEHWS